MNQGRIQVVRLFCEKFHLSAFVVFVIPFGFATAFNIIPARVIVKGVQPGKLQDTYVDQIIPLLNAGNMQENSTKIKHRGR